jgi:hypothetical protein
MGVVKSFKKLIHKTKDRGVDGWKDDLAYLVDNPTSVDSPTPSWVTVSLGESGLSSRAVLNDIDTKLDNFEIIKIIKPHPRSAANTIQSAADGTEVVFEEPRDSALKCLDKVKKVLASSFAEYSTAPGKPGEGRIVRIIFETKDRRSLPDADKGPKNCTRTASEVCFIPGPGVSICERS